MQIQVQVIRIKWKVQRSSGSAGSEWNIGKCWIQSGTSRKCRIIQGAGVLADASGSSGSAGSSRKCWKLLTGHLDQSGVQDPSGTSEVLDPSGTSGSAGSSETFRIIRFSRC
jgi:hypothetical protein